MALLESLHYSGGTGLFELAVTGGNQFITTANQIVLQQPYGALIVSGNLFFVQSNCSVIYIDAAGQQNSIVNNLFTGVSPSTPGAFGIYVSTSDPTGVVTGNTFTSLGTGVDLIGTSNWNVQANSYSGGTTPVSNVGTNLVGVATK